MARRYFLDLSRPAVAESVAFIASRLPPGTVDILAERLAPYGADIGPAAAALARALIAEAAASMSRREMRYAEGAIGAAVELAARRVADTPDRRMT